MREFLVQAADEQRVSHRGRLDIIANILASSVGGVRKTFIMYKCNLSFRQLETYLSFLLNRGLMRRFIRRESTAGQYFETTQRGMDFLRAYRNLDALMAV